MMMMLMIFDSVDFTVSLFYFSASQPANDISLNTFFAHSFGTPSLANTHLSYGCITFSSSSSQLSTSSSPFHFFSITRQLYKHSTPQANAEINCAFLIIRPLMHFHFQYFFLLFFILPGVCQSGVSSLARQNDKAPF